MTGEDRAPTAAVANSAFSGPRCLSFPFNTTDRRVTVMCAVRYTESVLKALFGTCAVSWTFSMCRCYAHVHML